MNITISCYFHLKNQSFSATMKIHEDTTANVCWFFFRLRRQMVLFCDQNESITFDTKWSVKWMNIYFTIEWEWSFFFSSNYCFSSTGKRSIHRRHPLEIATEELRENLRNLPTIGQRRNPSWFWSAILCVSRWLAESTFALRFYIHENGFLIIYIFEQSDACPDRLVLYMCELCPAP